MKNNIKKVSIVVLSVLLLTTGCTKYVTDDDDKRITNEETGQSLTSNLLCKPSGELKKVYEKYDKYLEVPLEKLPDCKNITIFNTKNYSGLWATIFVSPIAWAIVNLGRLLNNYGISVMLIGVFIRLLLMPFAYKTQKQSENLRKAQPEIERIEKKYANKTDSESMMAKSQETMLVYQKYKINPVGSCLVSFIQLPLFFAFLEAINRVPAIFEGSLWSLQLGTTPMIGIKAENYGYIILIVLIILTTYFSFKLSMNNGMNSEQQKQMSFMTTFMLIFISIASFSLPTAIALYWCATNGLNVIQTLLFKKLSNDKPRKNKKEKVKTVKTKSKGSK